MRRAGLSASAELLVSLHCALSLAVQCIVIGPVCVFATGGRAGGRAASVCYHDNSKLRASILTKLVLVKIDARNFDLSW